MTDEREREEQQKEAKFKVVDKRRINVDEIDASDPEEETIKAPDEPVVEEPIAEEVVEPELTLAGDDDKPVDDAYKPKFAPGVGEPASSPEMKSDEDPLTFRNIILNIMQTAATVALVNLGLVPHPQTNLVVKKFDEAKKAIDLFELLITNYGDELPENIRTEFQRALADLKSGYVNQM